MPTLYKTATLDDSRISYDFGVEKLSEAKNWKLFGKAQTAFYHLILVTQQEDLKGWLLRQFHYPRLGLASAYSESAKEHLPESKKSHCPEALCPDFTFVFRPVADSSKTPPVFYANFGLYLMPLQNPENMEFNQAIRADWEWLRNYNENPNRTSFAEAYQNNLPVSRRVKPLQGFMQKAAELNLLPELEYEFELEHTKPQVRKKEMGFYDLAYTLYKAPKQVPQKVLDYWLYQMEDLGDKSTCDCGNRNCTFEVLKPLQLRWFQNTYRDAEAVKAFWENLDELRKGAILFLWKHNRVLPLATLSLFEPKTSNESFCDRQSYCFQPDSEQEQSLRRNTALVFYLIRKNLVSTKSTSKEKLLCEMAKRKNPKK